MQLPRSADWRDGPGTTGTLTWKSIFRNCHLPRSFRLFGTALQSLSEDWLLNKLSKKTITPSKPFWTRALKLSSLQRVKPQSLYVRQYALIWDASPFHIWATIMDTYAFATVQCMTNSEESDRDLPFKICHTSTTQSTRMVPWSALRPSSSQENLPKDFGHDLIN